MGFFDSVLKAVNKAKNFVEDIQDKANEAYSSKPAQTSTPAQTSKPVQKPAEPYEAETISLTAPEGIASRVCNCTFFDGNEEADYEIEASMSIDNRFHEYDSGAAEFDVSYIYAPDYKENSDDILEWESGIPYIFMGFDQTAHNILNSYNTQKGLPPKTTLQKIEGNDKILYKTTHSKFNEKYVLYQFKRGIDHKILYQIGAAIPEKLVGTPVEKIVLDAADLMAATYIERIVNKTLVVK